MYFGEDKTVVIFLTDGVPVTGLPDGTPIDPESFDGLIVVVYEQKDFPIAMYSINSATGFLPVENIDNAAGSLEINLQRNTIKKYLKKKLLYEVKVRETNTDFEDDQFVTISGPFEIDMLNDCASKNIDVP